MLTVTMRSLRLTRRSSVTEAPDGWGSVMNRFRYKGFELILDLQYSYGNDVYELSTGSSEDRVAIANSYKTVLNAWTPQNQNTVIPEIRDTRAGYVINEDTHWLKDGSFLRGRNIMLGYTLSPAVAEKLKLKQGANLRIGAELLSPDKQGS